MASSIIAVALARDVLECYLVNPIKRQFRHVFSSKSYAEVLQDEVRRLGYEAERMKFAVEEARNNLRIVYADVTEWVAGAEMALVEATDLLDYFESSSKTCCFRTLPDPNFRYQFSRKAEGQIKVIENLTRRCSQLKDLNDISFSNPPPGNVAAWTLARREGKDVIHQSATGVASASSASRSFKLRDDDVFESRALIIQDIMDALADNSKSVVGVYGMGGVGKSTLLLDVERKIKEMSLFDLVVKADVSENPDIKRIQGEIAYALGLDLRNEEYVRVRANLLHLRLENEERNKKKVLIILDNLWKGIELKLVGIPCGLDNKVVGSKLLLASRNRDILRREMCCDVDFRLGGLQEAEAKRLFERMVGDKVHDDEFKPLVDEALHKCEGLPFLIISMAKFLKHAGLSEWKDTLKQIEMSKNEVTGMGINSMLQLSYDHLEEEVKSLLQLCVLYGVSEPSFENLVRYSVGSELFPENSSMEEARDRFRSLIQTLQASSLLLDNGDAEGFKVHDLVREFVASVASRYHPILVLKNEDKLAMHLLKDKLKSCMGICIPYIDINELPKELDCPELRIFLFFTNNKSLEVPDSYFNSMRELMVLSLMGICLSHVPSSFLSLVKLHTLCLDGCLLEDVAILGELKGLRILSFMNSKIHRLPKEIGQLEELRLLDLNHCSRLQIIEPDVLSRLIKLEELYMDNSFDRWNAVDLQTPPTNASLIELNNMKNLCTLHVSIPDPSVLPEDLNIMKLIKYNIRIGEVWRQSSYKGSRTLKLKLDPISNILQKGCVQTTLDRTDDLFLDRFNGMEQSVCEISPTGFPKLKHLHVQNSPSVHYILRRPSDTTFKALESLILKNLINLEKICHSHISSKSFKTLRVVRVESCDKIEVLFPLSLVREFPQLEEIGVIDCYLMREIIKADDYGKVELRNLHVLELRDLPDIKNFFTVGMVPSSSTLDGKVGTQVAFFNGQQVSIPSLESLTMAGLPNLKEIWSDIDLDGPSTSGNVEILFGLTTLCLEELPSLRSIWSKNPCGMFRFHNLNQLKVFGCDNLECLFFPSMVKSLAQLRELMVQDCKKMKSIIMEEEGLGMEISEALAFPMLTCLCFEHLESLTCFSRRKCSREAHSLDSVKSHSIGFFNGEVTFPCLETLGITRLDNVEMIWDNQIAAGSFHNLKSLCVHECNKLVNIIPSCILGHLRSLESLVAKECNSLELVFKLQSLNPLDGHPIFRSPLKELELYGLPELNCVWDRELHCLVQFQCLFSVRVSHCKGLTSLFPVSVAKDLMQLEELKIIKCGIVKLIEKEGIEEVIINVEAIEGPISRCFQHLKTLDVSDCDGLSNMFTLTIAGNLVELTKLRISNCKMLTEVISDEGGKERHIVAFNQLKYMELDGLMRLRCFSSGRFTLKFHLLKDVIVTGCPNMEFFSKGPIEAPKLEGVRVSTVAWFWKINLNITIQHMFKDNRIWHLE